MAAFLTVTFSGLAAPARADVLPPESCSTEETSPCSGKAAGDACSFASGTKGNCAAVRCTTDAGQASLKCVATGASSPGGCSTLPGAQTAPLGIGAALLLGLTVFVRRRVRA